MLDLWFEIVLLDIKESYARYGSKVQRIECIAVKFSILRTTVWNLWELCTKLRTVLRTLWCIWMMKWWLLWFQSLEASNNAFHGARTKLVSKSIYVYKKHKVNLYPSAPSNAVEWSPLFPRRAALTFPPYKYHVCWSDLPFSLVSIR